MGDLQPDNGGGGVPPDDGSFRGGLPDLPPEWGTIVIPDNAAELDVEATQLRREIRQRAWRNRLRGLVGLGSGRDPNSLGVPIVIMAVAVITTLLSLFVVTWDHERSATEPVGPDTALQQSAPPLADVTLADASGSRVRLGNVLPAMLLLVDDCACTELIKAIAAATPKPVTVVPISAEAACAVGSTKNVLCLADPAGLVSGRYPAPSPSDATTTTPTPGAAGSGTAGLGATDAGAPGPAASDPGAVGPSSTASSTPAPTAVAVPVDAYGVAHEPIIATSPAALAEALAMLAAGQ
jgi:hypothetical protein